VAAPSRPQRIEPALLLTSPKSSAPPETPGRAVGSHFPLVSAHPIAGANWPALLGPIPSSAARSWVGGKHRPSTRRDRSLEQAGIEQIEDELLDLGIHLPAKSLDP
jgi:hypothetical protein